MIKTKNSDCCISLIVMGSLQRLLTVLIEIQFLARTSLNGSKNESPPASTPQKPRQDLCPSLMFKTQQKELWLQIYRLAIIGNDYIYVVMPQSQLSPPAVINCSPQFSSTLAMYGYDLYNLNYFRLFYGTCINWKQPQCTVKLSIMLVMWGWLCWGLYRFTLRHYIN